jgi:hypothetical protein
MRSTGDPGIAAVKAVPLSMGISSPMAVASIIDCPGAIWGFLGYKSRHELIRCYGLWITLKRLRSTMPLWTPLFSAQLKDKVR